VARSTVVLLLTLGWLVVRRALDVSGFRSVLARDWHGYASMRLSAWELDCHGSLTSAQQVKRHLRLSMSTCQVPLLTLRLGMQRA